MLKHKQIGFFVLAGAMSATLEVGSFKYFSVAIPKLFPPELDLMGVHFPFSNILSTTLGIVSNYFLSIWFVFERGKHTKSKEFIYFISISVLSALLSLAVFQIFFNLMFKTSVDIFLFTFSPEMLSKVCAIVLVSMLNYSIKKKFIFNG